MSVLAGFSLPVACRKVNANGHSVVVTVGKSFRDALAQSADAHHQLCLIVHLFTPVGDEERLVVLQQCRVRLGENDGLLWFI